MPGNPACGPKIRVWDFFEKTGVLCLASQFVSASLASGRVAFGYENRVDPNCCGEQWDVDLGLYYNRARYLNVDSGRFWTEDEYEGDGGDPLSLHKYLYANANPVMGCDPSGNLTLAEVGTAALVVGITGSIALPVATRIFNLGSQAQARIAGMLRIAFGISSMIFSPAFGPLGIPVFLWGADETMAGLLQVITGRQVQTSGAQIISAVFGINGDTAETMYAVAANAPALVSQVAKLLPSLISHGGEIASFLRNVIQNNNWLRLGPSFSQSVGVKTEFSMKWGAAVKYFNQMPQGTLKNLNMLLRLSKVPLPGKWFADAGHLHLWF